MRYLILITFGIILLFWLLPRHEPKKISGYVVCKEYVKGHMCCSTPHRYSEAGVVVVPHVTTNPHRHKYEPSQFLIFIANREKISEVKVDSLRWLKYKCGQKAYYWQ